MGRTGLNGTLEQTVAYRVPSVPKPIKRWEQLQANNYGRCPTVPNVPKKTKVHQK